MKGLAFAAMTVLVVLATHAARATDVSKYSSRAALIGHRQEVTIAVLAEKPAPTVAREIAPTIVDVSKYNSKKALFGRTPEVSIAVLAEGSATERAMAAPSRAPHAVSVDSFNTKKALIGR